MGFLDRVFGEKAAAPVQQEPRAKPPIPAQPARVTPPAPTQRSSDSAATDYSSAVRALIDYSSAVRALIREALQIIEANVVVGSQVITVKSEGAEGEVIEGARKLEQAHELMPNDPVLHYAWASALHLAAQFKTAEEEMRRLVEANPQFLLGRCAIQGWGRWKSHFMLPPWGASTTVVHPAISAKVKHLILLGVRDGLMPRATLFVRVGAGEIQNPRVLLAAKIDITSMISPITNPQLMAICARIWENPKVPWEIEDLDTPLWPRGDYNRRKYEFLCAQRDIDLAIIDSRDSIVMNKRLPMPNRMQQVNAELVKLLDASEGSDISTAELITAIKAHQSRVAPSDVQYS